MTTSSDARRATRPSIRLAALLAATALAALLPTSRGSAGAQEVANDEPVVINEIFYHPPCVDPTADRCDDAPAEFIELHNPSDVDVDIGGWQLTDGVDFTFGFGTTVPAAGYVVVTEDVVGYTAYFPNRATPFAWTGQLSNNGERLALVDDTGEVVDEITYSDGSSTPGAWSVEADGTGASLSLLDAENADGTSFWWDAATPTPQIANANVGDAPTATVSNFAWTVHPDPDEPILVDADIYNAQNPVLEYRIGYPGTTENLMLVADGDGGSGWTATIPASAYTAGDLVRFRIQNAGEIVAPRSNDTIDWVGTTVKDPLVESNMPIIEWFTSDENYQLGFDEDDSELYDGVLAYNGVVVDNVGFRARGTSARSPQWTKRNWKFSMPAHHEMVVDGFDYAFDTVDLQGGFVDEARIREFLGHTVAAEMGLVAPQVQHVQLRKNGEFFGLHTMQEHPERRFLSHRDLDHVTLYRGADFAHELGPPVAAATSVGWETWDIPNYINLLAAASVIQHNDFAHSNLFSWYDPAEERMQAMLWDLDLSQGVRFPPTDGVTTELRHPTHRSYTWNRWVNQAPIFASVLSEPYRELYLRRVRTLADEWYVTGRYANAANEAFDHITGVGPEGGPNMWALDVAEWGFWGLASYGQQESIDRLTTTWLDGFGAHLDAGGPDGDLPPSQTVDPHIELFVDASPRDNRLEHVRIRNHEDTAIDLSGWQIGGSSSATLPLGSVIPANGDGFVVGDDSTTGFRAATTDAYVLEEYHAELPDVGGEISLSDPAGFVHATTLWGAGAPPQGMVLNEWNAVADDKQLFFGDARLGRIPGNGNDWFELAVTDDRLDIRGWTLDLYAEGRLQEVLQFSDDPLWSTLRAGTIITVAEAPITGADGNVWAEDPSYDPLNDDWWIHIVAGSGGTGDYISAVDFTVNNINWQLSVNDADDLRRFGPAGEGMGQLLNGGVSSDEVGVLQLDPASTIALGSAYDDADASTLGSPNLRVGGGMQDFSGIRPTVVPPGDVNCNGEVEIGDALAIAQYLAALRTDSDGCPNDSSGLYLAVGDLGGSPGTGIDDALLIAQCTVGFDHPWCT